MLPEDEIKRLKHFIVVSWTILLVVIVGLTFWASFQIRSLHDVVMLSADKQPQVIRGINGNNGLPGINGVSVSGPAGVPGAAGENGTNGSSVTPDQIAAAVSDYLNANPVTAVTGLAGTPGLNGRTLSIQVDPITCQLESKYDTDDSWTFIAQLSTPCSPSPGEPQ